MRVNERLKVALTRSPRAYRLARRPYALARYLARRPHDPDFGAFGLFPQTDRVFLDVGANAGMSAMSFRIYQRRAPIVSVEPNPFHADDLRFTGRVVRRFDYHLCAAGDSDGAITLHVPVYRGVPLTTEAAVDRAAVLESPSLRRRLRARMESADFHVQTRRVDVRPLDSLGLNPSFVAKTFERSDQRLVEARWPADNVFYLPM